MAFNLFFRTLGGGMNWGGEDDLIHFSSSQIVLYIMESLWPLYDIPQSHIDVFFIDGWSIHEHDKCFCRKFILMNRIWVRPYGFT